MKYILRSVTYMLGLALLALGIALSVKADLGISPIASVSYCGSVITDINYGVATFMLYALFVAAEFALWGRKSRPVELLQLVVSLVFSWVMDRMLSAIPYVAADHSFWENVGVLLISVVLIGVGVSWSVKMRIIPNPGDGIVQAIADKVGWELGTVKNVFDISCVVVTVTLSLVFGGRLIGIGVGTVISMLLVGRVVALTNRFVTKKLCAAVGL